MTQPLPHSHSDVLVLKFHSHDWLLNVYLSSIFFKLEGVCSSRNDQEPEAVEVFGAWEERSDSLPKMLESEIQMIIKFWQETSSESLVEESCLALSCYVSLAVYIRVLWR